VCQSAIVAAAFDNRQNRNLGHIKLTLTVCRTLDGTHSPTPSNACQTATVFLRSSVAARSVSSNKAMFFRLVVRIRPDDPTCRAEVRELNALVRHQSNTELATITRSWCEIHIAALHQSAAARKIIVSYQAIIFFQRDGAGFARHHEVINSGTGRPQRSVTPYFSLNRNRFVRAKSCSRIFDAAFLRQSISQTELFSHSCCLH
jgi:hypothetical protein